MGKKKTTLQSKAWRLAGESLQPAALSETEERILSDTFAAFQRLSMEEPSLGVGAAAMRGRETAVRACLGYFCERFGNSYEREAVTQALATAAAIPVRVGVYAPESSVLLGAALWILDYVEKENLQPEVVPLLPEDCEADELSFPPIAEFRYPQELLPRMMYVLLNRKSSSLKEFRKLIGLIQKNKRDDASKLRQSFRDALLDYFGRFLEVCKRVAPSQGSAPDAASPLAPLPNAKDLFAVGKKQPPPPSLKDLPERTPDVTFLLKTPGLIGLPPEKMRSELYYRRMSELLSEFAVRDPYEICAAYLLLERENDLLTSLNTLTNAVLACAERRLPWACAHSGRLPPAHGDAPSEDALRYVFRAPSGDGEPDGSPPAGALFSEPQLFYMATGYLLPRDRGISQELSAWFQEEGISEARSRELSMAAMAFSAASDARTEAVGGVWEAAGAESNRPAGEARGAKQEPDDAERIAELARQLKSAKQSAHEKEQAIRKLEEQLRDEQKRAEQDRMELRGLRDTLFRTRSGEAPEFSSADQPVQFPWQVRRRVLIFGGHDTWSKSIRPLLPGARFYERESLPDLNAVKGADVVWIQANALSHKFYYRIIETARRENIPVRYFGFASARKCAEQVVENELEEAPES